MNDIDAARERFRPAAVGMMPKLKPVKAGIITAWSLSRLMLWEQCPLAFRMKNIEKVGDTERGEALIRGDKIHKALENFVRHGTAYDKVFLEAKVPKMPKLKKQIAELRKKFLKRQVSPECQIALNRNWQPTGYFDKDVYVRVQADVIDLPADPKKPVLIIDYKSGRLKDAGEYDDTLELYGIGGLSAGLGESSEGQLWFPDHDTVVRPRSGPIKLKDLPKLQQRWDERAKPMLNDTRYAPRPGNYCRWCGYSKSKGGVCPY